jgi:hypothetical protein
MNDTFEIKRFGLLFKKTILERPLQLLGLTGLVLVATLVIYAVLLHLTSFFNLTQNLSFIWGFAGGGCLVASVVFNYFNTNASGSAYLTLPASAFEKWLCGILIAGVLFTGIFLIFFRVMDACFVTAYHNGLDKNSPHYKQLYSAVQVATFDHNIARQAIMVYANFVGAIMLGSLYFNRVSLIKTALVYCGMLAIVFFLNLFLANIFFKNVDFAFPFHGLFIKVGNDNAALELPAFYSNIVELAVQIIIPAILWLTIYIRLREKEI